MTEEEKKTGDLYDVMAVAEPPRNLPPVVTNGDGHDGDDHGSFSDRMESSPKLSDVQVVIRQLFPDLSDGKADRRWLNTLQMARVFPEYYVPLKRILVKHLVGSENMSVAQAIALVEVAVGIPIDGEGRIDAIAVMGRGAEVEEMKSKEGFPS